jgi:hypothetical protein
VACGGGTAPIATNSPASTAANPRGP